MRNRIFGLGALTMISACVSGGADPSDGGVLDSTVTAPPPLPPRDASSTTDASIIVPKKDASQPNPDPDTCLTPSLVTFATLDQDPGWKPAAAPTPACTLAEINQFESNLDDTNIKTWIDLGTGLGSTCSACIITSDAASNYGPIVYDASSAGANGYYNFGACFGQVASPACGKDVQYLEHCLDMACDNCTTEGDRNTCIEAASDTGGMCSEFVIALQADCKNLTTAGKKCNNLLDAAKTLCGPNAGDAGIGDAATDG